MKHVSIIIPEGYASLVNIEGTHKILSEINGMLIASGSSPMFDIHLAGLSDQTHQNNGLFTVKPDLLISEIPKTDLIIIPAVFGDRKEIIQNNKEFFPWIIEQYEQGAEVASYCIGAFLLAATGLLNGRMATTHWQFVGELNEMYPEINVVDDKILTAENRIYTSGGAYSFLNLLLYLIEKYAGRDLAVLASKIFMIDINRSSQSPFIIFSGQKEHDDEPVKKAQEYIENNFKEKITVGKLASMLALSRRNLERRFKKATANTVSEYIQRVKIEAAKMSLESSAENINEVMYNVGYSDPKAFRVTFKRLTGISPLQYRNKYNRELIS